MCSRPCFCSCLKTGHIQRLKFDNADLVGGTGAATAAWDQLVSEALNPTPAAQPYISQGGHLLPRSGPEPAPNRPPQDHVDNQLPNKEPDRFTGSEGKEYEPTQTGGTDSQADGSDDSMNDGGVSQLDNALKAFMQVSDDLELRLRQLVAIKEHVLWVEYALCTEDQACLVTRVRGDGPGRTLVCLRQCTRTACLTII